MCPILVMGITDTYSGTYLDYYLDKPILAAIASFSTQTWDIHNWFCHVTEKGMGEPKKKYKGHPLHHFGQGSEKKFMWIASTIWL